MPASSSTSATRADSKSSKLASTAASTHFEGLEELSQSECILRLEANAVGRVAAVLDCRPYVFPVNYLVHEGAIVFRTRKGSHLHMATHDTYAALEIDSADFMYHEGWSVLVQGPSFHVIDPAEATTLARVCAVPWGGDARDSFVRIRMDEIRGERITHRSAWLAHEFAENRADSENIQSSSRGDKREEE